MLLKKENFYNLVTLSRSNRSIGFLPKQLTSKLYLYLCTTTMKKDLLAIVDRRSINGSKAD
jgi:hypothetical protein